MLRKPGFYKVSYRGASGVAHLEIIQAFRDPPFEYWRIMTSSHGIPVDSVCFSTWPEIDDLRVRRKIW